MNMANGTLLAKQEVITIILVNGTSLAKQEVITMIIIHSKYVSVSDWLSITGYHRLNLVNRPITEKLLDD